MKTTSLITVIALMLWIVPGIMNAQDLSGLEIMKKVYNRDDGDNKKSELTMTLINSRGNKRVRELSQFYKDYGEEEKKIMFFKAPADVRNTSFMNWSYDDPSKDDDQWIYLPALKRVKRISSDNKDDYFMGSDFTYDDLGERHPNEDNHKLLRTENLNGEECYVVESTPKESGYMYSRTVTWVIKDKWIGLKKEFYDDDGNFLKTLNVKNYEKVQGYWTILHTEMKNNQKDHKTIMKYQDLEINANIPDSYFTERMMKRGL